MVEVPKEKDRCGGESLSANTGSKGTAGTSVWLRELLLDARGSLFLESSRNSCICLMSR